MVSRVCEEFHCTPAEALEQPYDLTLTIMHMRAYAQTKQVMDSAQRQAEIPETPMVRKVASIKLELIADAKAQRQV